MFDLRQLRTFLEITGCGSFSKAADRLRIAQPALTRQIQMLEATLETKLFDRHSRGIDLTDDGKAFLLRAQDILRETDRTLEEFRARSGTVSGPVALAIAPAMTDFLLGDLIAGYKREHPGVRIEIVEGFTGYIEEWLVSGRVDLAILYDPQPDRRIRCEALVAEKLYAIGPPEMTLRTERPCALADLDLTRLITASPGQRLRDVIESAASAAQIDLIPAIEANSLNVHKALLRAGQGISILPYAAIRNEVDRGELTAAPISAPEIVWQVTLATPAFGRPSLAARTLADKIRQSVSERVAAGSWPGQA